jgi:hypothetical protein
MDFALLVALIALGLFLAMLVLLEAGRRYGARRLAEDPEGAGAGTGAIEGAMFALLGLLVAFTFSGGATKFDGRRDLIVQEANAIGTAYLRLDLLPEDAQAELRQAFRDYLDARLATYRKLPDLGAAAAEHDRATALQGEIWGKAVIAVNRPGAAGGAPMLLLPALNDMIDITTTRTTVTNMHPPRVVYGLLFGLALMTSVLAGVGMAGSRHRSWVHMVGFAAALALAIYVILDLEYPRIGLIRVDAFDAVLDQVRASMT